MSASRLPPQVDHGVMFAVGSNADIDTTPHERKSC
jgi:hypothetical protein